MSLTVTLMRESTKNTKHSVRFQETSVAAGKPEVVGSVSIQKWALTRLGQPDSITVCIPKTFSHRFRLNIHHRFRSPSPT
jgi:hypothetical protein